MISRSLRMTEPPLTQVVSEVWQWFRITADRVGVTNETDRIRLACNYGASHAFAPGTSKFRIQRESLQAPIEICNDTFRSPAHKLSAS